MGVAVQRAALIGLVAAGLGRNVFSSIGLGRQFSLLSHGNLGSLCATLWSSGIVDREEADYGR